MLQVLSRCMRMAACCSIIAGPMLAFQYYGYHSFCTQHTGNAAPDWCASRLPYLYGHVQRKYWNVGLLRFYQWRQVILGQILDMPAYHQW